MNLAELYQHLSYGELQNLSVANGGDGTIAEKAKPRIVLYANAALLELYSTFVLREKDIMIEMIEGVTNYHFAMRFARSNPDECECGKYILDLPDEPFEEDVIKILAVHDSLGHELPLNDQDNRYSVFTPQSNVLQVPRPRHGRGLSVHYQASHPILDVSRPLDPILLPKSLTKALMAYVAYSAFSHMSQAPESSAKAQEHYSMFQSICANVLDKDTAQTSQSSTNVRFYKGGWI